MIVLLERARARLRGAPDLAHDVCHAWCCDEDLAMCGHDMTDEEDCGHADGACPRCPMCALMGEEERPCPSPECPFRDS